MPSEANDTGFRHVAYEDRRGAYAAGALVRLQHRRPGDSPRRRTASLLESALGNQPERLKALAQWVRRGGRLVVPISWQTQDATVALLKAERAWQPPIPVVPPRAPGNAQETGLKRLSKVEDWGGVRGDPFSRTDPKNPQLNLPIPVALLDDGKVHPGDWEVWAEGERIAATPIGTCRSSLASDMGWGRSFTSRSPWKMRRFTTGPARSNSCRTWSRSWRHARRSA